MFATVMTVRVRPGMFDKVMETWENEVLSAKHGVPGFQGATVLMNYDKTTLVEISLWESEGHATNVFNSKWGREVMHHFEPYLTSPPIFETYNALQVSPRMEVFAGVM